MLNRKTPTVSKEVIKSYETFLKWNDISKYPSSWIILDKIDFKTPEGVRCFRGEPM